MLPDPQILPHPSQATDDHPKSICPACGVTNDRAIHDLWWNQKHGYWWPIEQDWPPAHNDGGRDVAE